MNIGGLEAIRSCVSLSFPTPKVEWVLSDPMLMSSVWSGKLR